MARRRRHTREFKLAALLRMEGASDVSALAAELGIAPGLLYKWNTAYRTGGAAALRLPGERAPRPDVEAEARPPEAGLRVPPAPSSAPANPSVVAALERKVAQQGLELDFFRAALQHFAGRRRGSGGPGETGSTP